MMIDNKVCSGEGCIKRYSCLRHLDFRLSQEFNFRGGRSEYQVFIYPPTDSSLCEAFVPIVQKEAIADEIHQDI